MGKTIDRKLIHNKAKCLQCNEVLESKHRHDFQMCGCPNKAHVDGGLDYLKRGAADLSLIEDMSEWEEMDTAEESAPRAPSEELASASISLEPAYIMWALKEEQFDRIVELLESIDNRLEKMAGV